MKNILKWFSDNRWMLFMKPKGWTDKDEADYQKFCGKYGDPKALYGRGK